MLVPPGSVGVLGGVGGGGDGLEAGNVGLGGRVAILGERNLLLEGLSGGGKRYVETLVVIVMGLW